MLENLNLFSNVTWVDAAIYLLCLLIVFLVYVFVHDVTQKGHAIQRNYPVIGHFRYMFENMGEYFRQYVGLWFNQ